MIKAVLLLVVGTALSFITNNFIVTTVGCFLAGLVLNRGKGQQSGELEFLKTIRARSEMRTPPAADREAKETITFCIQCGAKIEIDSKFCEQCGTKVAS